MSKAKNIIEATECAKRLLKEGVSRSDTLNYIREVYPLNWDTANQILNNCNFSSHNGAPDNSILKKEDYVHISLENPAENSKNQKKNNSTKTFLYAFLGICALTGMFFIGKNFNSNNKSQINLQPKKEYYQEDQQGYVQPPYVQETKEKEMGQKNLETIVGMNEWAYSPSGFSFKVDSVKTRRISVHTAVFPNEEPSESSGINSWYDIFIIYASIRGNSDKIIQVIPSDFALRANGKSYWTMLNFDKEYAQRIMDCVGASRNVKEISQYSTAHYVLPFVRSVAFDAPYAGDITPLPQTILRLGHFSDDYKTQIEIGNPY